MSDAFITSRYVGFVAVAGTTAYELAIKEIFLGFSEKKHKVFGNFAARHFSRLNGRIKTREITENYLPRFGVKYVKKYQRLIGQSEKRLLRTKGLSVQTSYNNVIEWRNQFAHEGVIPTTPSYQEVITAYEAGKEVIHCLHATMKR